MGHFKKVMNKNPELHCDVYLDNRSGICIVETSDGQVGIEVLCIKAWPKQTFILSGFPHSLYLI